MSPSNRTRGSIFGARRRSIITPPPSGVYRPYLSTSAFNIKIPSNPVIHSSSSLMISTSNNFLLGGTAYDSAKEWLEPYSPGTSRTTYYRGDTSKLPTIAMYANNNGWIGAGPYTVPMPSWAAALQSPTDQAGDSYITLVDSITGDVWELYHVTPPGDTPRDAGFPSTRWNCTGYRHWSAATVNMKGYNLSGYTQANQPGTSASKIQMSCGLLIPEDFSDCWSGVDPGTAIQHRMRIGSFCASGGTNFPSYVSPANGNDGRQANGFPDGAVIQLDPSLDISNWASVLSQPIPWRFALMKICRGLQQFGMTNVDSTGAPGVGGFDCASSASVAEGGSGYAVGYQWPWDAAGKGGSYQHGIPYDLMSHFRVLDWTAWNPL